MSSMGDTEYRRQRSRTNPEVRARRRAASLAWKKRRLDKFRAIILAAKDVACVDCRIKYPAACMDLDHVRGKKLFSVSKAVRNGCTEEQLLAEIAKCEVRCSNCHRLRHA